MKKILLLFTLILILASEASAQRRAELPNPALTPGARNPQITQANIRETICNPHWSTKSIRPPVSYTTPLKKRQMKAYGRKGKPSDYEEDHLISLELGGAPSDPKNLWPEAYDLNVGGYQMGAREKDRVENAAHKAVCTGRMTLREAQDEIANDWTELYRKLVSPQFPRIRKP